MGLSGHESNRPSDPLIKTNPLGKSARGYLICFKVNFLDGRLIKVRDQTSQIEDGPEASILLWNKELASVKA